MWVANEGDDTVTRINASTGRQIGGPIALDGVGPVAIPVGQGGVWYIDGLSNYIGRINAGTGKASRYVIPVGSGPVGITEAPGFRLGYQFRRGHSHADQREHGPGQSKGDRGPGRFGRDRRGRGWRLGQSNDSVTQINP